MVVDDPDVFREEPPKLREFAERDINDGLEIDVLSSYKTPMVRDLGSRFLTRGVDADVDVEGGEHSDMLGGTFSSWDMPSRRGRKSTVELEVRRVLVDEARDEDDILRNCFDFFAVAGDR